MNTEIIKVRLEIDKVYTILKNDKVYYADVEKNWKSYDFELRITDDKIYYSDFDDCIDDKCDEMEDVAIDYFGNDSYEMVFSEKTTTVSTGRLRGFNTNLTITSFSTSEDNYKCSIMFVPSIVNVDK